MRRAVRIEAERDGVRHGIGDEADRRVVTLATEFMTEFMTESDYVATLVTDLVTESATESDVGGSRSRVARKPECAARNAAPARPGHPWHLALHQVTSVCRGLRPSRDGVAGSRGQHAARAAAAGDVSRACTGLNGRPKFGF
ncbi:MAG: hypothetical protein AB7I50_21920 [Vicinamibacterales bacterium]